jgi:hypothetical protein
MFTRARPLSDIFRAMNRFSYLSVLHVVEHEILFEVQNVVLEECRMSGRLLRHEHGESPQNVRFARTNGYEK